MRKIYLLSLFLFGLFLSRSFCKGACDTIITKDGRRIIAEIIRADQKGILYGKCGVMDDGKYFISQENVVELRLRHRVQPSIKLSPSSKNASIPIQYERLHRANDLGKPKTIIWVGFSPSRAFKFDFDLTGNSFLQFGGEVGFKSRPVRLGVLVRPIAWGSRTGKYANFKNNGLGGEVGLVLKCFTLGRLTGHLSKLYWGFDVLIGRQGYSYNYAYSPTIVNKVNYTWTTFMPRIGCQFTYRMLALDLALPIGYQRHYYTQRGNFDSNYQSGSLIIQPSVSVGFRF